MRTALTIVGGLCAVSSALMLWFAWASDRAQRDIEAADWDPVAEAEGIVRDACEPRHWCRSCGDVRVTPPATACDTCAREGWVS